MPIQYDYATGVSAGRASRIQARPHRCRTRAGAAGQAFRMGSGASCLACRVAWTRPATARHHSRKKRATGFGSGAQGGCTTRGASTACIALPVSPGPDPAVDARLRRPGLPNPSPRLALQAPSAP